MIFDPDGEEGDNPELVGSQIFIQKWDCIDGVDIDGRPEILDTNSRDGLDELLTACDLATSTYQFNRWAPFPGWKTTVLTTREEEDGDEPVFEGIVAEDGTIVDEEGGADEAVAGGPTGEGEGGANQGIVAEDEDAEDDPAGAGEGDGESGDLPALEIGGISEYQGWNGLSAGSYLVAETVPDGYGEPLVLCDGIFAGAEAGENIFELTAIDGAVIYDLSEGELVLCSWFNIIETDEDGNLDGEEADEGDDGDADEGVEDGGDGEDTEDADQDADGISDTDETDSIGTDPTNPDSDGDELLDGDEIGAETDPFNLDTDGDGLLDGEEVNMYGSSPLVVDTDEDGLPDFNEATQHGTDPTNSDTDADGVNDHDETLAGTDPLDPNS